MLLSQWPNDVQESDTPTDDTHRHSPRPVTRSDDDSDVDHGSLDMHPGDVVRIEEGMGVIRYLGDVRFAKGIWAGIELVEKMGMHDGMVGGRRYFRCKSKHGIFCDTANIRKKILPEQLLERVTLLNSEVVELRSENEKLVDEVQRLKANSNSNLDYPKTPIDDIDLGDRVRLTNRKTGTVKFIGLTRGNPDIRIGLEMDSWITNGNDGSKNGRRYFRCKSGWGYFARKAQIVEILEKHVKKEAPKRLHFELGDRVEIDRNRRGTIKYIGDVFFSKEEMVGLELDKWTSYGHDGTVSGKRYFIAQRNKGYFCKYDSVLRVLPSDDNSDDTGGSRGRSPRRKKQLPRRTRRGSSPTDSPTRDRSQHISDADHEESKKASRKDVESIMIGDKVRLSRGKVGRIKYIGRVEFTTGEVIGLELSQWTEKGHNGSVLGKRYFRAAPGRGYFTKRANIDEVLEDDAQNRGKLDAKEGDRVRLKRGKIGIVRFIGRVPGIDRGCVVGMELDSIGNDRGHDGYSPTGEKIFECRPGHGYWTSREAIAEILERARRKPKGHLRRGTDNCVPDYAKKISGVDFRIGDTVRLVRGKEGIVRFIGQIDGVKRGEVIGLELSQWSERGHDGSHNGKYYFSCPPGRGYFTTREAVDSVIADGKPSSTRADSIESSQSEEEPSLSRQQSTAIEGERVRLRNGRTGTILYIGKAKFAKGEIIGMELDQWAPEGNDGTMKGSRYFSCAAGHGYFTRREAIVEKLEPTRRMTSRVRRTSSPSRTAGRPRVSSSPRERTRDDSKSRSESRSDIKDLNVKLGDRVRLKRGKIGTVRYVGVVKGTDLRVVGLELEQWHERGNDGTFKGVRYFETRGDGWGYFTKPSSIDEILEPARP